MPYGAVESPLADLRVVEISGGVATAYAGRVLTWLGASVLVVGTELDTAAEPAATQLVADWLHEGKEVATAERKRDLAKVIADAQIVLLDTDDRGPELSSLVRSATNAVDASAHPPVVVHVSSVADRGKPIPGSALTAAAWSGLSWSMGSPGKAPLSLPFDLPSFEAGAHAAAAALAVVVANPAENSVLRNVDVSARDVLSYYTGMITANFIPYERPWRRDGARPPGSGGVYPASIFPCKDGFVTFMCRSQREWKALLEGMGSPEWSRDPRFEDPRVVARLHADEADSHLVPWIAERTKQELLEFGHRYGLPIAPVRSFSETLREEQFRHRKFFVSHPRRPDLLAPGAPWRLNEVPGRRPDQARDRRLRIEPASGEPCDLLSGLRVLDLSWVWSGPMVTSMLTDLGAEVLKIEHSGHMDAGRMRGRARRDGREVEGPEHEVTPYFNQMNHGKRSVTLDLKEGRARELLLDLAGTCDVVVENMRPGALSKLGLGFDELSAHNPGIVMLSMSMAGQTGPLKTMKGYAGIMAAMSGLDSIIGYDENELIGSLTPALGDPNGASHGLVALLAALHRRRVTGRGAWIDLSQIEALLSITASPLLASQLDTGERVPVNTHPGKCPHGHFPASGDDRWLAITVQDDSQWQTFVELARCDGHDLDPHDTRDESKNRLENRAAIEEAVSAWTADQDRDELADRLIRHGIPAAPVTSFEDLASSDWAGERHLRTFVQHPYLGETPIFVLPWKFAGRAAGRDLPAPILGTDTDDVLTRLLQIDAATLAELHQSGSLR
ncbi:CoA transferase [Amycolatopsis acidicola]|uniref:CoA transferase n=2 Tax=Amycolatopsis acidicola TaxID=2596893 RepID=A0A5N0VHD3_9PSEU|nr:CoA transferase [Amycolatopsis acidicola]